MSKFVHTVAGLMALTLTPCIEHNVLPDETDNLPFEGKLSVHRAEYSFIT